ncbi:MAG: hypothetical protein KGQ59_09620 [Bdellovibrionales bacterium]|nr:hypothetical protein [Bdellovibrionales bacterium]
MSNREPLRATSEWFFGKLCSLMLLGLVVSAATLPAAHAQRPKKPLVLVYNGKGACPEGCARAVGQISRQAGFDVQYVNEKSLSDERLQKAQVYVQPGGDAFEVLQALRVDQLDSIRAFIASGGSYLGICAGAFLADTFIDDAKTVIGLGILPGETLDYHPPQDPALPAPKWKDSVLRTFWDRNLTPSVGGFRYLYFSEGAGFQNLSRTDRSLEILGWYENGVPGALRFHYGAGKVLLSGMHPEATRDWWGPDEARPQPLVDPDGLDHFMVREFLQWLNR